MFCGFLGGLWGFCFVFYKSKSCECVLSLVSLHLSSRYDPTHVLSLFWEGGWWWWTSAVVQTVIQLLKTSCPVPPCLTKGGGAVWPLLTPFLKPWRIFEKRSPPTLEVGTAFAFCFQKLCCLWGGCRGGVGGHGEFCLGLSYVGLWPSGKWLQKQPRWTALWLGEHFLSDLKYDPKVCSETCLQ